MSGPYPGTPSSHKSIFIVTAADIAVQPDDNSDGPTSVRLITPFTLEYTYDSSESPQRSHYAELVKVTTKFIDESFKTYFSEIADIGYVKSQMQFFYIRHNNMVEFQLKSEFQEGKPVPSLAQLNSVRRQFFTESGVKAYVSTLGEDLGSDNVFYYTVDIIERGATSMTVEENVAKQPRDEAKADEQSSKEKSNSKKIVVPIVVVGSTLMAAIVAFYFVQKRKKRFTVKDEEDAEIMRLDEEATLSSEHKSSIQGSAVYSTRSPDIINDGNLQSALDDDAEDLESVDFRNSSEDRPLVDTSDRPGMKCNVVMV